MHLSIRALTLSPYIIFCAFDWVKIEPRAHGAYRPSTVNRCKRAQGPTFFAELSYWGFRPGKQMDNSILDNVIKTTSSSLPFSHGAFLDSLHKAGSAGWARWAMAHPTSRLNIALSLLRMRILLGLFVRTYVRSCFRQHGPGPRSHFILTELLPFRRESFERSC